MYPFFAQLEEGEIDKTYFQQDSATAHTARMFMALLDDVFADSTICKTIWPPRFPDLSPPDLFLWGAMKNSLYSNNPHIIDDLKMVITEYIRDVDRAILNTSSRIQFGVAIAVWRLAGDTCNIACNFLYCNHQSAQRLFDHPV